MDVRIGVTYTAKELEVELGDEIDGDTLKADLAKALADGTPLWLTDRKGRQIGVPAEKVAWVEIGRPDADRRIGFGG
ncbi:MAG: DUF3107 domain-containing protein [Acidimicrobiales bacterium]